MTKDFNAHKRSWHQQRREKRSNCPSIRRSFTPGSTGAEIFDGIGVPETVAFIPDAFGLEGVEKLSAHMLSSAPTAAERPGLQLRQ